jgi:hypothetical protein
MSSGCQVWASGWCAESRLLSCILLGVELESVSAPSGNKYIKDLVELKGRGQDSNFVLLAFGEATMPAAATAAVFEVFLLLLVLLLHTPTLPIVSLSLPILPPLFFSVADFAVTLAPIA